MNHIFYIMGKSSSGKDSVYKRLLSDLNLIPVVTYTTRPMRENECNGREYHFVDKECFDEMCRNGEIIEKRIYNTVYGEWIYFTSGNCINLENGNYIGIGTLESYVRVRDYFGSDTVIPIYIEVDDDIRLIRAVERERLETFPKYKELCRRFIADSDDFSEENLLSAGVIKRFYNNTEIDVCVDEIENYINKKAGA